MSTAVSQFPETDVNIRFVKKQKNNETDVDIRFTIS